MPDSNQRSAGGPAWLEKADRGGRWLENALLAILLGGLIILAGGQILLRNVFAEGFSWTDPLLRILVLWVGMLGAVAASREDKHISIDIFSRLLQGRALAISRTVVALFTAGVCGLLAWHTFRFVQDEYAWSDVAVAGLPIWVWQSILPLGFGLITWRYILLAISRTTEAVRGAIRDEGGAAE